MGIIKFALDWLYAVMVMSKQKTPTVTTVYNVSVLFLYNAHLQNIWPTLRAAVDIVLSTPALAYQLTDSFVCARCCSLVSPEYYSTDLTHFALHLWLNYSLLAQNPVSFVILFVLCLRVKIVQGMFKVQHSACCIKRDWNPVGIMVEHGWKKKFTIPAAKYHLKYEN